MHFDFSEEQRMLADSVRKALQQLTPTAVPVSGTADDVTPSFDAVRKALTDIGLFGILVPEEQGGLGLGLVDAVAVAIETGRAALPFPAIEGIAAMRVAAAARPEILDEVLAGTASFTSPIHGDLKAGPGNRPTIGGTISLPFADRAQYVVASVSTEGSAGRTLLAGVNGDAGTRTDSLDLSYPLSRVEFSRQISANELVPTRIDNVLGILAAAELVGASEYCLTKTVSYLKERRQFGKIIGSFQGLKHMAADCQVWLEGMKASVEYAAALHDRAFEDGGASGDDAETAFRIAKSYCSEMGQKIAEQCIQLHGGIAFTWEYGLHIHLRRIARLANSHGTAYQHRDVLAEIAIEGAATYGGLAAKAG